MSKDHEQSRSDVKPSIASSHYSSIAGIGRPAPTPSPIIIQRDEKVDETGIPAQSPVQLQAIAGSRVVDGTRFTATGNTSSSPGLTKIIDGSGAYIASKTFSAEVNVSADGKGHEIADWDTGIIQNVVASNSKAIFENEDGEEAHVRFTFNGLPVLDGKKTTKPWYDEGARANFQPTFAMDGVDEKDLTMKDTPAYTMPSKVEFDDEEPAEHPQPAFGVPVQVGTSHESSSEEESSSDDESNVFRFKRISGQKQFDYWIVIDRPDKRMYTLADGGWTINWDGDAGISEQAHATTTTPGTVSGIVANEAEENGDPVIQAMSANSKEGMPVQRMIDIQSTAHDIEWMIQRIMAQSLQPELWAYIQKSDFVDFIVSQNDDTNVKGRMGVTSAIGLISEEENKYWGIGPILQDEEKFAQILQSPYLRITLKISNKVDIGDDGVSDIRDQSESMKFVTLLHEMLLHAEPAIEFARNLENLASFKGDQELFDATKAALYEQLGKHNEDDEHGDTDRINTMIVVGKRITDSMERGDFRNEVVYKLKREIFGLITELGLSQSKEQHFLSLMEQIV